MNDDLAICLDGPLNGQYASYEYPPEGYERYPWPTGEKCLIHTELGYRGSDD